MQLLCVRDVMSRPAITVSPTTSLYDVQRLMQVHHLRRLPVMNGDTLVGIISRGDVGRAFPADSSLLSADTWRSLLDTVQAEEIMTTAVVTVAADATIAEAAVLMLQQRVSSLPVVEREQLIGMITESDLFKLIAEGTAVVPHASAV